MRNHSKQRLGYLWIKDERGSAAIIVTIITLAIAVLVISVTALIGLDDLEIGRSSLSGGNAILSAESCAEEALIRLSRNNNYSGGVLAVGETVCTIAVLGTPCGSCVIDAQASDGVYTRKIQVGITMTSSNVDITSWEEVN